MTVHKVYAQQRSQAQLKEKPPITKMLRVNKKGLSTLVHGGLFTNHGESDQEPREMSAENSDEQTGELV